MAMSKEMSTDWQLPGVPQPSSTLPDTRTDGWLLTRVASRLDADPHKLRRFALLLGIDDDTYRTIQQQADVNRQRLPSSVSILSLVPSTCIPPKWQFSQKHYFQKWKNDTSSRLSDS